MIVTKKTKENGQALVLLAFAVVALLGFAAFAIDGGMVYADRRYAQNAADAASLAGGAAAALALEEGEIVFEDFVCGDPWVVQAIRDAMDAAVYRAGSNGFTIAKNDLKHGVTVTCDDNHFNGSYTEKYIDILVRITIETQTTFAHFVYDGPLVNTVEAIVRVRPETPVAFGHAIVALNPSICDGNKNGVIVDGSTIIRINGGGVFTNGCLRANGSKLEVTVVDGGVGYVAMFQNNTGENNIVPSPVLVDGGQVPDNASYIPPPDCSKVPNFNAPSNSFKNNAKGRIEPGNYTSIKQNDAVTLVGGGLYCLHTGDFDAGNNNLSIDESNGKKGVTIYLIKGGFITNGGGVVRLSAPPPKPDPDPAIPGVLIYLAEGNTSLVMLRGNSVSSYWGIVYAPDGRIDAAGTSGHESTLNTQLIGKNVIVGGNARLDINYSGREFFRKPTVLGLYK